LLVLGLGLAAAVWGFLIEPGRVRLTELRIETARWPAGRPPLRIAVLGCLHVGAPHIDLDTLDEVIRRINGLEPDLVVLLGDFVIHGVPFGDFVAPEATAGGLARLSARHGVFAVLGNHDWWLDGPRVRRALEGAGIVVLDNEAQVRDLPEGPLWLAGLADDTTRLPDAPGTLAGVPADEPVVVLAHDPAVFFDVPARAVATLTAHTHGGQVYLPFFGALITPGRAPRRFAYGHIREDGKDLYVTAGLGTSILPVRFNMPPEIALVTIAAP
jgi:predicted MPP superfamily phosphohydrolase